MTRVQVLKDIPKQLPALKRLVFDSTGMPSAADNSEDPNTDDPSNLGKLRLVGKDYPVGNGHGPIIGGGKEAAIKMSPGAASIYDEKAYEQTGNIVRKPLQTTPAGMQPWMGADPSFFGVSPFGIGRSLRQNAQQGSLPSWIRNNKLNMTGFGAGAGGLAAAGAGDVHNWLNPDEPLQTNKLTGIGAAIGALLGALRKNQ